MSFKVEIIDVAESKKPEAQQVWCSNGLRFTTREKAEAYGRDLFSRWMGCAAYRVAESTDPVNE